MSKLPFRQVHLDFHTSEKIPGIGSAYNEEDFINTLKSGHVNSITVFAKCHHGWSYYPSKVNPIHPNLKFDLLSAQLKACKKAGIRAPIYISAGYDEKEAVKHPEWIVKPNPDFKPDFSFPHYQLLCMNSPYLNLLIEQVEEVMQLFNPDEIFLDICGERRCYCENCIKGMKEAGLDPESEEDHDKYSIFVYAEYCRKVREAVDKYNSETAVFHNGGNIIRGRRDLVSYESHLELESLPTGGWGYDHFPMSAAYCRNLGKEYLGMTGKFHVSWGEFGGFKHPNALIYETSLSLALGAKCSIGDQLHPCGELNSATYNLIGKAYKLVEEKEPWCDDVSSIADIAILSAFAVNKKESESASLSDTGAGRILSEKHYLYDIIDSECDFSKYKVIILPDCVESNENVDKKLAEYISNGGKILASGLSGKGILPGIEIGEQRELKPNYMHPVSENGFVNGITEYVMYTDSYRFEPSPEYKTVAYTVDTYFNRTSEHFCSHQHTPNRPGFLTKGSVISDNIGYIDHKIFEDYAVKGELHCKELCDMMLSSLLGESRTASVEGLPDRGVFTLLYQKENNRLINHILYAHTSIRGKNVEAIEDCVPLYNVSVKIRTEKAVKNVRLVPEGQSLPFEYKDGLLTYTVPKTLIHSMVEISF